MRRTIGLVSLALSAVALPALASAQAPADPFERCAQKTDDRARLACFDQEMQRRHAQKAAQSTHVEPAPPAAKTQPAPAVPPSQQASSGSRNADERGYEVHAPRTEKKEALKPLVAQVAQATYRGDHRYTITLDNGQVWEQVENQPGLSFREHDTVSISSGALGGFFLETSAHQFVRVRRVR